MTGWCSRAVAAAIAAMALTGCARARDALDRMEGRPLIRGAVIDPAVPRPDVTMIGTAGTPFAFATATRGRVTLVTFGYTHCPDVCPVHMANIAAALKRLPAGDRGRVMVVFVTTDPARDSLPQLRRWLASFDPAFIGLRGTDGQLAAMERAFGIPPAQREGLPGGGYGVSHSAQVFAFTPDDRAHVIYLPGMTSDDYAHDLPRLLRNVY